MENFSKGYTGFALLLEDSDERKKDLLQQFHEEGMDDSETWNLRGSIVKYIHSRLVAYYEIADKRIDLDYYEGYRQAIEEMISLSDRIDHEELTGEARQKDVERLFFLLSKYWARLWW